MKVDEMISKCKNNNNDKIIKFMPLACVPAISNLNENFGLKPNDENGKQKFRLVRQIYYFGTSFC